MKEEYDGYLFERGNIDDLTKIIKRAEVYRTMIILYFGKNARAFAEDNFNNRNLVKGTQ